MRSQPGDGEAVPVGFDGGAGEDEREDACWAKRRDEDYTRPYGDE